MHGRGAEWSIRAMKTRPHLSMAAATIAQCPQTLIERLENRLRMQYCA